MKNILVGANIILIILVCILFYLYISLKKNIENIAVEPTFGTKNSSLPINDTVLKFSAFINTDSLFEKYFLVKKIKEELADQKLKAESSYNSELKKFEKEVQDFQEKATTMSQQEGESIQMALAEKEQKLMKLERDLGSKMADVEMEKNKLIQKTVVGYLEKINFTKNYSYVFGYNGMGNVLLAHPSFDITQEIIKGLNDEYTNNLKEQKVNE